jgi:hypothetical protein
VEVRGWMRGLRPLGERFRLRSSSYDPDKSLEVGGKGGNSCLVKVGTVADSTSFTFLEYNQNLIGTRTDADPPASLAPVCHARRERAW